MRNTWTWVVALGVALLVAGSSSAQDQGKQRRGGGGFGGGMFGGGGVAMLLANEGVQKELKLTDEQKEKATEFGRAQFEKMRELPRPQAGERPDPEKMREAMKPFREAEEKFVKETLKPEQQKRLTQIQYQANVLQTLSANEKAQKELKLTDAQKEKLKTLNDDLMKDRRELMQGGFSPETMQKAQALTKEYTTKATDVLTADQKKTWKEMTGEPFELQMQRGRRQDR
jgi:hypothetical protein